MCTVNFTWRQTSTTSLVCDLFPARPEVFYTAAEALLIARRVWQSISRACSVYKQAPCLESRPLKRRLLSDLDSRLASSSFNNHPLYKGHFVMFQSTLLYKSTPEVRTTLYKGHSFVPQGDHYRAVALYSA